MYSIFWFEDNITVFFFLLIILDEHPSKLLNLTQFILFSGWAIFDIEDVIPLYMDITLVLGHYKQCHNKLVFLLLIPRSRIVG